MSEDLTSNIPESDTAKLTLVLSTVQALVGRVDSFEPVWQKVVTQIGELREGQRQLVVGQQLLERGQLHSEEVQRRVEEVQLRLEEGHRQLEEGQRRLEDGQEALRSDVRALRRTVDHRFLILSGTVLEKTRDLHKRVTRLELSHHPPNSET